MMAAPHDLAEHRLSARLARDPGLVSETARHFGEFLEHRGLPGAEAFKLRLVLSEVLNNLVEHVQARHGDAAIEVECHLTASRLYLVIRDSGPAMQALPAGAFPDGLSESGRGWPIIHSWADQVRYRRGLGYNILEMERTIAAASLSSKQPCPPAGKC